MLIKAIILESEDGGRVKIPVPVGVPLQPGGILRNISLGAIRTSDLIRDLTKSAQRTKDAPESGVSEKDYINPTSPEAQVTAMMENAAAKPPVFVSDGEESTFCGCKIPLGTGKRCMNCGKLTK